MEDAMTLRRMRYSKPRILCKERVQENEVYVGRYHGKLWYLFLVVLGVRGHAERPVSKSTGRI